MKTKIHNSSAVRRAALIVAMLMLPAWLAAQPGKTFATRIEAPIEVPPPALKEETFLGVSTHSVDAALAAQMELPPETGLVVVQIMPDSPANEVLKPLDLLTRFDDQILIEPRQLGVLVRSKKEGDEVKLTLFRAGKKQTVSVKLAKKEMPPLPARFVPGSRKVVTFEGGEPFAGLRASRPGPVGAGAKAMRPAEMRISRFEGKNSAIFFDDGEGRLEVNFKDGKKQLKARDAKGKVVFDGPVETPEDRKALPADVRARLEKMEAMDVHIPAPPAGEIHEFRAEPGAFAPGPVEGGETEELEFFARPLPAAESDIV